MDNLLRKLATLHVPSDPAVMDRSLDLLIEVMEAERGFILVSPQVALGVDSAARTAGLVPGASQGVDHGSGGEPARVAVRRALAEKQVVALEGERAVLAAPLLREGTAVGAVYLDRRRAFAEADRARLAALAEHVVTAIDSARDRESLVARATRLEALVAQEVTRVFDSRAIVGTGPATQALRASIERVAATRPPVLITGEAGTGKELIARALHAQSGRAHAPFIPVDAVQIPSDRLESELLGHERDASDRRLGRFELAEGGTLFLSEIAALDAALQVKLLRVLQEKAIERVGALEPKPVDVRFIAATHVDLAARVAAGTFRQDLYEKLAALSIAVPPLRERREDVPGLATHFARVLAPRMGRPFQGWTAEALARLSAYAWPGNLRELRNAVERALIVDGGPLVRAESLPLPPVV